MFPINVVEKETGFSKYLLRMWERRYSFPRPARDEKGDRLYSVADIEKLKLVKLLMAEGFRPSKIMNQAMSELEELLKNFKREAKAATKVSVIVLTNPALMEDLRKVMENHGVREFVEISKAEDLGRISL